MNYKHKLIVQIITYAAILFVLFSGFIACKSKSENNPVTPPADTLPKAAVWLTEGDQSNLFTELSGITIRSTATTSWPIIRMDTSQLFQSIDGFGAALTGSSAYLINRKLTAEQRTALLEQLFDREKGIGISYLRLTIGASDFSLNDFTYNDMPAGETDFDLTQFDLGPDKEDLIPVLKEILQINPDIKLMGSPWSPPAWMKTNGSLKGGQLKPACYDVYARYFVKYIQAMAEEGIRITSVTPQNEPLHFTANYPCMEMQADEQAEFVKTALGPRFQEAGLTTQIILYDHNWDDITFGENILNDPAAYQYVAGTAFHGYAGNVSAMTLLRNAFPEKGIYFTEISGGDWAPNFSDNLMWNMHNIFVGGTNNWAKTALLWNLALNENNGPTNNGCSDCRGVVTIDQSTAQVKFNEEYYSLAHFTKFVRPDARRVSLFIPQTLTELEAVAFVNTDQSKVFVISNQGDEYKSFGITQGKTNLTYSIPPRAVATIIW